MSDPIAPLVPADVDLTDFQFMPLDVRRLRDSRVASTLSGEGFRCAVLLWCAAWHQKPAGSLPDDEVELSQLAGFGRAVGEWRKMKAEALYGWVKCIDGRLYHPVVAEKANEAWTEKQTYRWRKECDRLRKLNAARKEQGLDPLQMPPSLAERAVLSAGKQTASAGNENPSAGISAENALKGQGQGQGQGLLSSSFHSEETRADAPPDPPSVEPPQRPAAPRKRPFPKAEFEVWYGGYPHKVGRGAAEKAFEQAFGAGGVSLEVLVTGRDAYVRSKPAEQAWCNPATWLHQRRWLDQPARASGDVPRSPAAPAFEPRIDLGGIVAPHSTIRSVWGQGRWPSDWGPRPGQAGCRISAELMSVIMAGQRTESTA